MTFYEKILNSLQIVKRNRIYEEDCYCCNYAYYLIRDDYQYSCLFQDAKNVFWWHLVDVEPRTWRRLFFSKNYKKITQQKSQDIVKKLYIELEAKRKSQWDLDPIEIFK